MIFVHSSNHYALMLDSRHVVIIIVHTEPRHTNTYIQRTHTIYRLTESYVGRNRDGNMCRTRYHNQSRELALRVFVCICVTILHLEAHYCSNVRNSPESTWDRCTSTEYLLFRTKKSSITWTFFNEKKKKETKKKKESRKFVISNEKKIYFVLKEKIGFVLWVEVRFD